MSSKTQPQIQSAAYRPESLLKPLFNGVLFPIYYFKKRFKPCFFILKALKDILQHFKLVNLWICEFVVSFFWCHEDVIGDQNSPCLTPYKIGHNLWTFPKEFQKKSDKEIIGKYCRFLLGAYKACVANFLGLKLRRKVWENEEKEKKKRKYTSTTVLPIPTTSSLPNEKIYFRL